jgi:hypothetical protein
MVLGGPVPEGLRDDLSGVMDLIPEGGASDEDVDGVLIHARQESLPVFRRFRKAGGSLPIFALAEGAVDLAARLQWIRYGADDLLEPDSAAEALIRKIRDPGPRGSALEKQLDRGAWMERYLRSLGRYLQMRDELVAQLPDAGRQRYLDTVYARDQVLRRADADSPMFAIGQRRTGDREPFEWPVTVLDPRTGSGDLLNVGTDGVSLAMNVAPAERMRLGVAAGAIEATLDVEVRWQRRAARDRWEVGALASAIRLVKGG